MSFFGDLGNNIGNFFGSIFNGGHNQSQVVTTTTTMVMQRPQQQNQNGQNGQNMPSADMLVKPQIPNNGVNLVNINQTAPPTTPKNQPAQPNPSQLKPATAPPTAAKPSYNTDGLSDEDKATVQTFINRGTNPNNINGFITAAKSAAQATAKSNYENSVGGKVLNTIGQVGRTIGGGLLDGVNFLTRIPETLQATKDSATIAADNLFHVDNKADTAAAMRNQQAYDAVQKTIGNVTNAVAGENIQTNDDTNREAKAISTGQANPGELFSAATKSLGAATLLPTSRIISTGLEDGGKVVAKEVADGISSVNPTREADAAAQLAKSTPPPAPEALQSATDLPPSSQPIHGNPPPVDTNVPTFIRNREAAAAQAPIDEATNLPPSLNDIPAFQRQGKTLPSIEDKQNRIDELSKIIEAVPSESETNAIKFNLKQQYATDLRTHPQLKDQLASKLKENLTKVDADAQASQAARDEHAALQKEVSTAQQQTKTAKALQDEANQPPPAETPTVPAVDTPVTETNTPVPNQPVVTPAVEGVVRDEAAPTEATAPATETPAPAENTAPAVQSTPGDIANAPRVHDQIVKQMGDAGKEFKGQYGSHAAFNYDDAIAKAKGVNAQLSDEDLLNTFTHTPAHQLVNDPNSASIAVDALDRLNTLNSPEAQLAKQNVLNALDEYASKSGQGLGFFSRAFDTLPVPLKTRYLIKQLDKANEGGKGYLSLADHPDLAAPIDAQITSHLQAGEEIKNAIASVTGKIDEITKDPVAAQEAGLTRQDVTNLVKEHTQLEQKLAEENGKLLDYFHSKLPDTAIGNKINDFAKTMMLSSVTGRLNDVIGTAANTAEVGARNVVQGLMAKAINLFRPGTALDTLKGNGAFLKGTAGGLKRAGQEFDNTTRAGDLTSALKGSNDDRYEMAPSSSKFTQVVHAATRVADRSSEGLKTQHIYQQASKEAASLGRQNGWDKATQKLYTDARAASPTPAMKDSANELWTRVNNLNDNPISRGLQKISEGIGGDRIKPGDSAGTKLAKTLRNGLANQILPFTKFLGGNIWNSFTDKNVVASATKAVVAASKGDLDGVLRNVAQTTTGAGTLALGYLLTQSGIITNKDEQGYTDSGAYFHIGGRYIPVGLFISFAPNLILGNALHNGVQSGNGNVGDIAAKTVTDSITNLAKSTAIGTAVGVQNTLLKNVGGALNGTESAGDAGAALAANGVGQYLSGAIGDINAVLNNGVPGIQGSDGLNPTHEAAQTKATKTSDKTGNPIKDIAATSLNQIINKIPVASQLALPRNTGVAAPDLIDRTTHGSRDTDTTIQKANATQATVSRAAGDKANDIPNPDDPKFATSLEAHIQNGKYDSAIAGLNQQIENYKKDPGNIPKSDITKAENQIKELQILKDNKYDPSIRDLYKNTGLSEWRNMGDPNNDAYDQKTYDLLYQYDGQLANSGISGNTTTTSDHKYSPKAPPKGRGGSGSRGNSAVTSNTIGSTPNLQTISFGKLAPVKVTSAAAIPTISQIKSTDLIKPRAISVTRVK